MKFSIQYFFGILVLSSRAILQPTAIFWR
jgi:hypothetical protein